jgi:hypothetical protein
LEPNNSNKIPKTSLKIGVSFMSYLISMPNTIPILQSTVLYTTKSSYKFHIEFIGQGVDAFLGQIPKNKAIMLKNWDRKSLSNLFKLYNDKWRAPQRLVSEIPIWAHGADHYNYFGLDVNQTFEMTVYDDDGNILYVNDPQSDELVMLSDFDNELNKDNTTPQLYAKDVYPFRCRFTVNSNKPFDVMLIAIDSHPLMNSMIMEAFEYDGENISCQVLDRAWADEDQRDIKIIYN